MRNEINEKEPLLVASVTGSRFIPMLFSTPMVEALLNNSKKETRRTQGLEKINTNPENWVFKQVSNLFYFTNKITEETTCIKSKMNVGDIIWVRETFRPIKQDNGNPRFEYKATENINLLDKWKPSLFMPKEACRLFLKCISVSVERLQDIDENSALNEGIIKQKTTRKTEEGKSIYVYGATQNSIRGSWSGSNFSSIDAYRQLWREINGMNSWNENPFVWVYKFVKVDVPDGFS